MAESLLRRFTENFMLRLPNVLSARIAESRGAEEERA
jgi:hypothetical protein